MFFLLDNLATRDIGLAILVLGVGVVVIVIEGILLVDCCIDDDFCVGIDDEFVFVIVVEAVAVVVFNS